MTQLPEQFTTDPDHVFVRIDSHLRKFTTEVLGLNDKQWRYIAGDEERKQHPNHVEDPTMFNRDGKIKTRKGPVYKNTRGTSGKFTAREVVIDPKNPINTTRATAQNIIGFLKEWAPDVKVLDMWIARSMRLCRASLITSPRSRTTIDQLVATFLTASASSMQRSFTSRREVALIESF